MARIKLLRAPRKEKDFLNDEELKRFLKMLNKDDISKCYQRYNPLGNIR